jgi:hypothetical protein
MAKNVIENMEIKINGANWNEVMLSEYEMGRRVEHTYHSVPKKLVMKLLNATKAPDISDFESWLKEDNKKKEQERSKDCCVPVDGGSDWWACRD